MQDVNVVYHLAAIPHPFKGGEIEYRRINYEGAITVFECAKRSGITKFIFASSGCVYGFWGGYAKPDQLPITENNYKPTLEGGQTLYGYYKYAFEKYLEDNSKNIKSIAIRIEGVNPNLLTSNTYKSFFLPDSKPEEKSCKVFHLLTSCSVENYLEFIKLVIRKDLQNNFETFNIANEYIHPSIDVQEVIEEYWPNIPNHTKDNETLYSIAKAKELLGYDPSIPNGFSENPKNNKNDNKTKTHNQDVIKEGSRSLCQRIKRKLTNL